MDIKENVFSSVFKSEYKGDLVAKKNKEKSNNWRRIQTGNIKIRTRI